jgi:hypothetical protein
MEQPPNDSHDRRNRTEDGARLLVSRNMVFFGLSVSGYLVLAYIVWWGVSVGQFDVPGGDAKVWDRAGDQVRFGINPYERVLANPSDSFWYAPPIAMLFAITSMLPVTAQWLGIVALEIAALRYVTGSWRTFGIFGWFPLTAFELVSGNFNLIIVAGVVMAIRGKPELATIMSFAKLTPILAVAPRYWRRVGAIVIVAVAITLPALWLWPTWVNALTVSYGQPLGIQIPIPFPVRAAVAGFLLLLRRPWSRAVAAVIAIPAFYFGSLILLLVVLADRRRRSLWFGTSRTEAHWLHEREHGDRRAIPVG